MAVSDIPGFKYLVKHNRTSYLVVILFFFGIGTIVSIVNWHYVKSRAYSANVAKYDQALNESKSIITGSLSQYSLLLDDGASLLTVNSNNVNQNQWLTFFQSYDLATNYPGVDGVNFAEYVSASQLPNYLSNLASQGQSNFSISPAGSRSLYIPTTYIGYVSPLSLQGLGLDQLSNPVRMAAITQALNSGLVTMSGKIISLAFHKGQPAFIIYKPIYNGPDSTLSERQSSIYGFVYVGVDSNTFFNALLSKYLTSETAIQIYDGGVSSNDLLYATPGYASRLQHIKHPIYSTVNITFDSQTWYIRVITAEALIQTASSNSASNDLLVGLVISLAIACVIWYLTFYRDRKIFWQKQMEVQNAKDELLSLASHQLRTPATIVKQYLGVMLQNYSGSISKEQREIIQTAYNSNERQLEIANQFLNAARLDSGRIKLTSNEIVLNELLEDVVSEQQKIAKTRRQKIVFKNHKRRYKLYGDPKYLPMVFENLISNAIKYSKRGTLITVTLQRLGNNLLVTISDQGMGISANEQQAVFEKFTRASSETNAGRNGTGIGLYLAKQIVDLHGGDISVESTIGKGSKFTVILPMRER